MNRTTPLPLLKSSRITTLGLGLLALGLVAVGPAQAVTTVTADLAVSATVAASCTISTSPLAFGTYDPIVTHASAPRDSSGTVTVTCTKDAPVTIGLTQGANDISGTSNVPARRMRIASTAFYLNYTISQAAFPTLTEWGDTTLAGRSATGTGAADVHTIYGRIPAGQTTASIGSYADTVVASVDF